MPRDKDKERITCLVSAVKDAEKEAGPAVCRRLREFSGNKNWFSELCFCLLTANYTAAGGIRIQEAAGDFSRYTESGLRSLLKRMGHRFWPQRAERIFRAGKLKGRLGALRGMRDSNERREWLVRNVKGLGYKEASHFLRNVGYFDVAIIDKHVMNVLCGHGIIERPKTLTRKRYLEIEEKLAGIAERVGMSQGELDLYLWYMKTGKVLK